LLCQHLATPLKDAVEGDEGGVKGVITPWVILGGGVIIPWVNLTVTGNVGRSQLAAGRKTALRNAALAAAADDLFMDR
jgi:hypothetical protein